MTNRYEYKGHRYVILRYCRINSQGVWTSGVIYHREDNPDELFVREAVSFNEKFKVYNMARP